MQPKNYETPIINPEDPAGPKVLATIPHSVYLNFYRFDFVKYENLRVAKEVLESPSRIFAGVRRFNDGGWCFTGKPRMWYIKEDVQAPFPKGLVFAVYLNPRLFLYEARAERCAADDEFNPIDWKDRYTALIWKCIS